MTSRTSVKIKGKARFELFKLILMREARQWEMMRVQSTDMLHVVFETMFSQLKKKLYLEYNNTMESILLYLINIFIMPMKWIKFDILCINCNLYDYWQYLLVNHEF